LTSTIAVSFGSYINKLLNMKAKTVLSGGLPLVDFVTTCLYGLLLIGMKLAKKICRGYGSGMSARA